MGNGPGRIAQRLTNCKAISCETIAVDERPFELGTTIQILRMISEKVTGAIAEHRLPILLAGGCLSTLGALSAIGPESTSLIWFDAHGDFNTPETTPSGFMDGMAISAITGGCWRTLTASVPGFRPFPEKNVLLIGARDLDREEQDSLEGSEVTWLRPDSVRKDAVEDTLGKALAQLPERVYFHIDLDVLDCTEAHVNEFSCPGGLTVAELSEIIRLISRNRSIVGASITAYDPSVDQDLKGLNAGVAVVEQVLAAACIAIS
jgi:arginase